MFADLGFNYRNGDARTESNSDYFTIMGELNVLESPGSQIKIKRYSSLLKG